MEDTPLPVYFLLPPLLPNQNPSQFRVNAISSLPPDTVFCDSDIHNDIINIVNQVWDRNIQSLITSLTLLIAPSPSYIHEPTLPVLHHFRYHGSFSFIWFERSEFLPFCPRHLRSAKYAVVFHVTTPSERHRAIALAYMLLRFCEENIRAGDYHIFRLLALSYRFIPYGIHGVMFFDDTFQFAHLRARSLAFLRSNGFTPYTTNNIPVLRWFLTESAFTYAATLGDRYLRALIRGVRKQAIL